MQVTEILIPRFCSHTLAVNVIRTLATTDLYLLVGTKTYGCHGLGILATDPGELESSLGLGFVPPTFLHAESPRTSEASRPVPLPSRTCSPSSLLVASSRGVEGTDGCPRPVVDSN